MKSSFRLLLIALTLTKTVFALTESFDIATFVRPAGWTRAEHNGVLVLRSSKTGRVQSCQIFLFPSVPANGSAATIFQTEWDARINRPLGLAMKASPQTQPATDGWTSMTGVADSMQAGVPQRTLLMVATGFGRSVSIVAAIPPNSCRTEIEKFFTDLNLNANAAGRTPPSGGSNSDRDVAANAAVANPMPGSNAIAGNSLDSYTYAVPSQWTRQAARDRIVLSSPVYDNGERCQITMLPMRSSSQPLAAEAIATFRSLTQADPLTSYPSPPPRLANGTSPQGWEYFTIRKLVGGQEGEARTVGVTLLLVRLNNQTATVVGMSKDFLWSRCFGELDGDAWPRFFDSLGFGNAGASLPQSVIRQALAGEWTAATSTVGLQYTFLANGRYKGTGATRFTSETSTTTQTTMQAFFGDGSYSTDGNTLVLTGDDQRRSTMLFRLEKVSKDSGQTWGEQLCTLDPGAKGEVCYRRE